MCRDDGRTVADAVNILCADQVNDDLDDEVHRDQRADFREGNVKLILKGYEQKRRQVVDDRLRDVADVAGEDGMAVGGADVHDVLLFNSNVNSFSDVNYKRVDNWDEVYNYYLENK